MASLSTAEESLGVEGNLQMAKDPASAETELHARTAENEKELEMSIRTGTAGSETGVTLLRDEGNGATHTGAEKVTNNDASLLVSPVLPAYDLSNRGVSESGQILIRDGNGELLYDEDGNIICEQPGWHVMCDQDGMVLWDVDGQLCIAQDEVDEDLLVLQMRSVHKQAPESLVEQNQQLQAELQQAQFAHQSDVKRARQVIAQVEVQNQTDFRAMAAELEKKKNGVCGRATSGIRSA